ncbi:MAG TPA: TlpA disulfide reductase family protein [Steroidobacteraceae bacterium]|nr:TlpA disulfide reductase family protein [Steroidobacteraceae bacterium]
MKSRWLPAATALTLAGILGCGALGFLVYRLAPQAKTVAESLPPAQPLRDSAPLPPNHPIPETLPEISLPDSNGTPHRLSEWTGKPLVLNFWATWCEPCRREIPLLEELRRENHGNGFEIVGIAIDHRDSVTKYVQEMKIDYPVLVGERGGLEAAAAFGMEPVLPFSVFADAQGRIVTLKIGELHRDEAAFILARLADVGAGRLGLQAARAQIDAAMQRLAVSRAAAGGD